MPDSITWGNGRCTKAVEQRKGAAVLHERAHIGQSTLDVVAIVGHGEFDLPTIDAALGIDGGKPDLGALGHGLAEFTQRTGQRGRLGNLDRAGVICSPGRQMGGQRQAGQCTQQQAARGSATHAGLRGSLTGTLLGNTVAVHGWALEKFAHPTSENDAKLSLQRQLKKDFALTMTHRPAASAGATNDPGPMSKA
jgi:hypothetical protein